MGIRLKCWNIPRKNKAIMLPMSPLNAFPIIKNYHDISNI